MSIEIWFAPAAANFVACLSPGQNVACLGAATVRMGLRGGLATVGGILLAELLWSILALSLALGARAVSPALVNFLQLASAFVLVWLGLGILRDSTVGADARARQGKGHIGCVAQGVWVGLANPLALIFFLSLFPGFVSSNADVTDPLVTAFYASAVLVSSAAGLSPYLVDERLARVSQARGLQMVSGGALLLLGALLLWRCAAACPRARSRRTGRLVPSTRASTRDPRCRRPRSARGPSARYGARRFHRPWQITCCPPRVALDGSPGPELRRSVRRHQRRDSSSAGSRPYQSARTAPQIRHKLAFPRSCRQSRASWRSRIPLRLSLGGSQRAAQRTSSSERARFAPTAAPSISPLSPRHPAAFPARPAHR